MGPSRTTAPNLSTLAVANGERSKVAHVRPQRDNGRQVDSQSEIGRSAVRPGSGHQTYRRALSTAHGGNARWAFYCLGLITAVELSYRNRVLDHFHALTLMTAWRQR